MKQINSLTDNGSNDDFLKSHIIQITFTQLDQQKAVMFQHIMHIHSKPNWCNLPG